MNKLLVKNSSKQILTVELPEGSHLFSGLVDKYKQPIFEGDRVFFRFAIEDEDDLFDMQKENKFGDFGTVVFENAQFVIKWDGFKYSEELYGANENIEVVDDENQVNSAKVAA